MSDAPSIEKFGSIRLRSRAAATAILIALSVAVLSGSSDLASAQTLDNNANAKLLANRAAALLRRGTEAGALTQEEIDRRRGSPTAGIGREADCGGVAIGNVRPSIGDVRQNETTVIILGDVINTNNRC